MPASKPLRDLVLGLSTAGIAVAYSYQATRIPSSSLSDAVGAGGLPFLLGLALAFLGGLLALRSGLILVSGRSPSQPAVGSGSSEASIKLRSVLLVGIGAGYIVMVPLIGYLPALALLLGLAAILGGARPGWRTAATAVLLAGAFTAVFVLIMGTRQPKGMLAPFLLSVWS